MSELFIFSCILCYGVFHQSLGGAFSFSHVWGRIQTTEINSEVNLWTRFLVHSFNRLPARYWYEYGALFTNTNYFRIELKSCEIHLFSRTFWLFLSLSTFWETFLFFFYIFNICNPMFLLWKLFALFFALNSLKSQSAF